MSSKKGTSVPIVAEINVPTLNDLNPLHGNPLVNSIANGEIPSNAVMNDAIDKTIDVLDSSKYESNLSSKGTQLVNDAKDILQTAEKFINEKNKDDRLQQFIKHSADAGKELSDIASNQVSKASNSLKETVESVSSKLPSIGSIPLPNADQLPSVSIPGSVSVPSMSTIASTIGSVLSGTKLPEIDLGVDLPTDELKDDAADAYYCARALFLAAARSSEFRNVLLGFLEFFQGSFGNVSERLQDIGEAVKKDIKKMDVDLKKTKKAIQQNVVDAKETAQSIPDNLEWNEESAKEYYKKFSGLLNKISGKREYKRLWRLYWKWMDIIQEKGIEVSDAMKDKAEEIKDQAVEKLGELQEQAVENVKTVKKAVRKSTRKAAKTAKKKVEELKEQAEEAVDQVKEGAEKAKDKAIESAKETAQDIKDSTALNKVWDDIKGLIDAFAGQGTFDRFYVQSWKLYSKLYTDKEISKFFKSFRKFAVEAVENPSLLEVASKVKEGQDLISTGRELLTEGKWASSLSDLLGNFTNLLNVFSSDRLSNELVDKIKTFGEHLVLDSQGRPDIYVIQESLGQIRNVVYPLVTKQLENLNIVKIAGCSESVDWAVENLVVNIPSLLPECFQLRTENNFEFNVKEFETEKSVTKIVLEMNKLKPVLRDVRFWYNKKNFPAIEDYGTVDIDLSEGEGIKLQLIWKIKSKQNRPFSFSLVEVKCVIDNVDIRFIDAKHEILDRIALTLFMSEIKQQIANGVVNKIVDTIQPLNDQMNQWLVSRPVASLGDKVNDQVQQMYEKGNQFIQSKPLHRAVDYAKEKGPEIYNSAKDSLAEKSDQVMETVNDLKRKLPDVSETVNQVKDKATELKDQAVSQAVSTSKHVAKKAKKMQDSIPDDVKQKATEMKDTVSNMVTDGIEQAQDFVEEKKNQARDMATEKIKDAVCDQVQGMVTDKLNEWTSAWQKPKKSNSNSNSKSKSKKNQKQQKQTKKVDASVTKIPSK